MFKQRGLTPLALALILTSSSLIVGCDNKQSATPAAPPIPSVDVVTLETKPFTLSTELSGRTSPYQISDVRPQVNGIILKRQFVEGSDVTKGDSLYQIDPASYQAAYDMAKGDLTQAEANANIANITLRRYQSLYNTRAISAQDYDNAKATAQQANAAVVAAKAALENARINLAYTKVYSPISGKISRSSVTEGALVTAGQATALATVQQLNPIYVDVTQSSTEFLQLKKAIAAGQLYKESGHAPVELILEDGSTYSEKGTLEFSEVTVDESTGTITLRAIFPNPNNLLLPGMFVRAKVNEGVIPNAILVPQQGITHNPHGDATAMVVNQEGKAELRTIQLGQAVDDKWLVNGGLKAGDQVIVTGLLQIRPGVPVKATEYSATPAAPASQ